MKNTKKKNLLSKTILVGFLSLNAQAAVPPLLRLSTASVVIARTSRYASRFYEDELIRKNNELSSRLIAHIQNPAHSQIDDTKIIALNKEVDSLNKTIKFYQRCVLCSSCVTTCALGMFSYRCLKTCFTALGSLSRNMNEARTPFSDNLPRRTWDRTSQEEIFDFFPRGHR